MNKRQNSKWRWDMMEIVAAMEDGKKGIGPATKNSGGWKYVRQAKAALRRMLL